MASASKIPTEAQPRPDVGDTLLVIHDFQARSSDELSLAKGDRVELIERDDEFGDGWFLGRHFVNGNTGLFPEVYTKPQPAPPPTQQFGPSKPLAPLVEANERSSSPQKEEPKDDTTQSPLAATSKPDISTITASPISITSDAAAARSPASNGAPTLGPGPRGTHDNHVMNETLNVINEHITNLRSPPSSGALHVSGADSGSEYSMPLEQRMSYIQGEETDEEEEGTHTRPEVESWTPDDVAEYLFSVGVEQLHCEVFREQEISGEVILGMDQSSLFIKAFDLGSVGRRLKTWQKIKALQDEVHENTVATRRTTRTYGSDVGLEDSRRSRSRTNTLTSNRPMSVQTKHGSMSQTPKESPSTLATPASPQTNLDSPSRPSHVKRPSAASVRELNHTRRHSSTDFRTSASAAIGGTTPRLGTQRSSGLDNSHKKQPSFDRNWTLGNAFSQPPPRPLSSTDLQVMVTNSDPDLQDSAVDLDKGYFSSAEGDGRKRNVLRKRDGEHSRKSSYTDEQRVRSATALSRHSRFGSVDSYRDGGPTTAAQKYYGVQSMAHRRTASTNTTESARPLPPAKDAPSPTVTRLDGLQPPSHVAPKPQGFNAEWLSAVVPKPISKARPGVRAISEKLTTERFRSRPPVEIPASKGGSIDSPVRTESSTPSAGPSFEMDSPDTTKSPSTPMTPASRGRKKGKKETSAYTKGLLRISPKEAKIGADYYGWMKKKSSHLMTTWKPRLFVLKGRRLAYYYSEDDDQERGLIDISFHRVLPADNEKLTGLHATISSAVGGSALPSGQGTPSEDDSTFIFKLVPPRAGLSRAVNFTKPTVHYFAVPNLTQGRLWMAALMKATIDRDDTQPITSTYQQKTISLAKAKQMRHRPPALMNLDETTEEEPKADAAQTSNGLGIFGDSESGVSSIDKLSAPRIESARLNPEPSAEIDGGDTAAPPQSA